MVNLIYNKEEYTEEEIQQQLIHELLEHQCVLQFENNSGYITRSMNKKIKSILKKTKESRDNRICNECHLSNKVVFDLKRSLVELNYVIANNNR